MERETSEPLLPYGANLDLIVQGMSTVIQHQDEKLHQIKMLNEELEFNAYKANQSEERIKRHLALIEKDLKEEANFYTLWTAADTKAENRAVEIDSLNRKIKKQERKIIALQNPRSLRNSVKSTKKYAKQSGIILKCPFNDCIFKFSGISDKVHKHLMAKKSGHKLSREEKNQFIQQMGGLKSVL